MSQDGLEHAQTRRKRGGVPKATQRSLDDQIESLTEALHKALLDLQFLGQNKPLKAESRIRCTMLIATLRSMIAEAVGLANKCEALAEQRIEPRASASRASKSRNSEKSELADGNGQ